MTRPTLMLALFTRSLSPARVCIDDFFRFCWTTHANEFLYILVMPISLRWMYRCTTCDTTPGLVNTTPISRHWTACQTLINHEYQQYISRAQFKMMYGRTLVIVKERWTAESWCTSVFIKYAWAHSIRAAWNFSVRTHSVDFTHHGNNDLLSSVKAIGVPYPT